MAGPGDFGKVLHRGDFGNCAHNLKSGIAGGKLEAGALSRSPLPPAAGESGGEGGGGGPEHESGSPGHCRRSHGARQLETGLVPPSHRQGRARPGPPPAAPLNPGGRRAGGRVGIRLTVPEQPLGRVDSVGPPRATTRDSDREEAPGRRHLSLSSSSIHGFRWSCKSRAAKWSAKSAPCEIRTGGM